MNPYFDATYVNHGGNQESRAAHETVIPRKRRLQDEVLDYIKGRGAEGATPDEAAEDFGLPLHSISGRFTELKAMSLIAPTLERRPTRSGNLARVCVEFAIWETRCAQV